MSIESQAGNPALENLRDSGLSLDDESLDIRNRRVIDVHGDTIGHVSALFVDRAQQKIRMLEIRAGGILGMGERHVLLPVDAVTSVTVDAVHVNESHACLMHSPAYDPLLVLARLREYWEPFYGYYGASPHWGEGYMYPNFPTPRSNPVID